MLDGTHAAFLLGRFRERTPRTARASTSPTTLKGSNGQTTAWHTTTGSYSCRAICIDPHTPERVLYVSNNEPGA